MNDLIESLNRVERGVLRPADERLCLSLDSTAQLKGEAAIGAVVTRTAGEIPFLLHPGFLVREMTVNGTPCTTVAVGPFLQVAFLPFLIAAGAEAEVRVRYEGAYALGVRTDEVGGHWWEFALPTLWRPIFTLDLRLGARSRVQAALPSVVPVVHAWASLEERIPRGTTTCCTWDTSPAVSLDFAFVGGKGQYSERRWVDMVLSALTTPKVSPQGVLAIAQEVLSLYTSLWGPCPYPRLAVACPPGSATGNCAREGLVVAGRIGAEGLDCAFSILSHEVAHLWWGIGVRLDPTRPGVEEGLASYASLVATREALGREALCEVLGESYLPRAKAAEAYGTALADCTLTAPYSEDLREAKGGCVFLLLERRMGEEPMARGLQRFMERFRGRCATVADLRRCLAEAGGLEVHSFFDAYVAGTAPIPESVDHYVR